MVRVAIPQAVNVSLGQIGVAFSLRLNDLIAVFGFFLPRMPNEFEALGRRRHAHRVGFPGWLLLPIASEDLPPCVSGVVRLHGVQLVYIRVGVFIADDAVRCIH